jgi:hypothetical protein
MSTFFIIAEAYALNEELTSVSLIRSEVEVVVDRRILLGCHHLTYYILCRSLRRFLPQVAYDYQ